MNNYCILSVYNYIYKGATVVQYSICVLGFCCFICNFVHAFPYVFAFTCKNIINFPELINSLFIANSVIRVSPRVYKGENL